MNDSTGAELQDFQQRYTTVVKQPIYRGFTTPYHKAKRYYRILARQGITPPSVSRKQQRQFGAPMKPRIDTVIRQNQL